MKTVAIKVDDELHARLAIIAQLEGTTLTEVIRQAVVRHVETLQSGEELAARAQGLLEEIEQESASRREAVQRLLGQLGHEAGPQRKGGRRRNGGDQTS